MSIKHLPLVLILALGLAACDETLTAIDTGTDIYVDLGDDSEDDVPEDTAVDTITDTGTDTGGEPMVDMPGGDQTCSEVWTCLEGCGDETACITACVTEVCFISRDPLNTLLACKNTNCFVHCRDDLTAELCLTCIDLNCPDEKAVCESAGC